MRTMLFSLLLLGALPLWAQDSLATHRKVEFGLNITATLANFLNSNAGNSPVDPYLISIKWVRPLTFRVAADLRVSRDQQDDGFGFVTRKVNESTVRVRAGLEKRIPVSHRFSLHWGGDILGEYQSSNIESITPGVGAATLMTEGFGVGGGPFMGIQFRIHPRVILSTEAACYAVGRFSNEQQRVFGDAPKDTKIQKLDIVPYVPSSLYVHFSF